MKGSPGLGAKAGPLVTGILTAVIAVQATGQLHDAPGLEADVLLLQPPWPRRPAEQTNRAPGGHLL